MTASGANVPLFWHLDRQCRTTVDSKFLVFITSKNVSKDVDLSCRATTNTQKEINFQPMEVPFLMFSEDWNFHVSISSRIKGLGENSRFTLMLVDPDAPTASGAKMRYWLHWLSVDIELGTLMNGFDRTGCDTGSCTTVVTPAAPSPPRGSGLHRYQFLLFLQPSAEEQQSESKQHLNRDQFNPQAFKNEFGLKFIASAIFSTRHE